MQLSGGEHGYRRNSWCKVPDVRVRWSVDAGTQEIGAELEDTRSEREGMQIGGPFRSFAFYSRLNGKSVQFSGVE